jgi:hypothetical protein
MLRPISIRGFLVVQLCVASYCASAGGQNLDFSLAQWRASGASNATLDKAIIEARMFVANPANKADKAVLSADYFKKAAEKDWDLGDGDTLTLANSNYIVAAILVSKEMQDLLKTMPDATADELRSEWLLKRQPRLKKEFGELPNVLNRDALAVWDLFLLQWVKDVMAVEGNKFKEAFREASYEIVAAMVAKRVFQEGAAAVGPGGDTTQRGTGGGTSSGGAYFPFHERRMNHIYRHNERRISKAERIRARRY